MIKIIYLLKDKNIKIVSSKDALSEIVTVDWSKDVVNCKKKITIKDKEN